MIALATRLSGAAALLACSCFVAAESAPPTIRAQALILGESSQAELAAVFEHYGGDVTHRLPIIGGIGGVIGVAALDALEQDPAVGRLIEDLNPRSEPERRECPVAGSLQANSDDAGFTWRIFNYADSPQTLEQVELSWPDRFGAATVAIKSGETQEIGSLSASGVLKPDGISFPTGVSILQVAFARHLEAWDQNAVDLALTTADCTTSLPSAYADNHGDFYFPTVVGADLLNASGLTGSGVTVAVVDSGLWNQPALTRDSRGQPRVPVHYNAILDVTSRELADPGGHGSHMASIIANSLPVTRKGAQGFKGIAPDVSLLPITAFSPLGDGDFLDIIRGVQWVVDNRERYNIRVLNLSLSALPRFDYWDDPINQAVFRAWQAGITVVAAAGNDGPEWGSIGSPGNNPYVITVGAVTDSWTPDSRDDDYVPEFSARGPTPTGHIKPDLVAPGGHITGLVPHDSVLARESPDFILETGEFVSTGSSQAAAVISGVAALLLQADPSLSNDDIKCLLVTSAEPAIAQDGGLAYSPFVQGSGYANASRALTLGSKRCRQNDLDIEAAINGTEQLIGPAIQLESGDPSLPDLDTMMSAMPEYGVSTVRWGAKAHLDRLDPASDLPQAETSPFNWVDVVQEEQQTIQSLSDSPEPD